MTPWQAANLDVALVASLAGREDNQDDWAKVIEAAGLRIREIQAYNQELADNIIVAVLPPLLQESDTKR